MSYLPLIIAPTKNYPKLTTIYKDYHLKELSGFFTNTNLCKILCNHLHLSILSVIRGNIDAWKVLVSLTAWDSDSRNSGFISPNINIFISLNPIGYRMIVSCFYKLILSRYN